MAAKRNRVLPPIPDTQKTLRGAKVGLRHICHDLSDCTFVQHLEELDEKCAQTRVGEEIASSSRVRVDSQAAMLQAISIGTGFPMMEPWIINEILRREEERKRGERPQLELAVPGREWSPEGGDFGDAQNQHGDPVPERGVVIIGM